MSKVQIIEAKLSEGQSRLETGAIQIGDDWPGTFLRGDDSFRYKITLEAIYNIIPDDNLIEKSILLSLIRILDESNVKNINN